MTNEQYQEQIDNMSEHLISQVARHADNDDFDSCQAIYQEWMVNGQDPEDGEYAFQFIPFLSALN